MVSTLKRCLSLIYQFQNKQSTPLKLIQNALKKSTFFTNFQIVWMQEKQRNTASTKHSKYIKHSGYHGLFNSI